MDEAGFITGQENDRRSKFLGLERRDPLVLMPRGGSPSRRAHPSIIRVRVGPGATALTRTPLGPYSAAQAFVNSSRAARLAPYRAMPACPKLATIVETLTIEPDPRSAMAGASDDTRKNGILTFSAKVSSNSASVAALLGPSNATPALLMRMST